jgi:glycosyltransferase involved in cell wall biosynthesis
MRLIYKIAKNEYQIAYFMNITWITPRLVKILSKKKCVVIYDASNIQMGISGTLGRPKLVRIIVKILESAFITDSDFITTLGISFHQYFLEHYSKNKNIFYISNPIGIDNYSTLVKNKSVSNLQTNEKLKIVYTSIFGKILVAGKYVPRGWELIELLSTKSNKLYNQIEVHFVGTGSAIDDLHNLARDRGVIENCFFTGFLPYDKFLKEISSADIGFMEDYSTLGYRYTVGSKVQEYMAAALPVVTGSSPEKLYMLKNQGLPRLLYTPPILKTPLDMERYVKELVKAFEYALENPTEIKKGGERNRLRAEIIFSNSTVEKMLTGFYCKVLQNEKLKGLIQP